MTGSLKTLHCLTASNTAYISALWSFEYCSWTQRWRSLEKRVTNSSFPSPHKDSKASLVEFGPSRIWRVEFLQARSKYQNAMIRNFTTCPSGTVMIHVIHFTSSEGTEEFKTWWSVPVFSVRRTISFAPGVLHCPIAAETTTKITAIDSSTAITAASESSQCVWLSLEKRKSWWAVTTQKPVLSLTPYQTYFAQTARQGRTLVA